MASYGDRPALESGNPRLSRKKKRRGLGFDTVLCCAVVPAPVCFKARHFKDALLDVRLYLSCSVAVLFWVDGIGRHSGGDRDDELVSKWIDDTPNRTPKLVLKWSDDAVQGAHDGVEV